MRHPSVYVSGLRNAAEEILAEARSEGNVEKAQLAAELTDLADEWQTLGEMGGRLMRRTYTLTGEEIEQIPWVVPKHPALAKFHANILKNDVT